MRMYSNNSDWGWVSSEEGAQIVGGLGAASPKN